MFQFPSDLPRKKPKNRQSANTLYLHFQKPAVQSIQMDIDTLLTRGVSEILPDKKKLASLLNKKRITLYQGFDPTADSLHIGHFIGIRKLAQFQKLGHKVIFLIGDFTGMVGDPTDKSAARVKLTPAQIKNNYKKYKKQVEHIIDFEGPNKAIVRYNSQWLSKLNFSDILELSSNFTVQQMLEREFFAKRIVEKKPIYLHEFLYPLMQGYDSIVMDVDLEVGGNDQLFNMMAGRHLMKNLKNKEKFVLTMKLLTDKKGQKMGKTTGNAIFLSDTANDIFGKVMSMSDDSMPSAIELLTDLPLNFYENRNPLETKKKVAFEITSQVHGINQAEAAQKFFEETFQKGNLPENVPSFTINSDINLIDLIDQSGIVQSKSQIKRLLAEGAISIDGNKINDTALMLSTKDKGKIIKIGKTRFLKLI